MPFSHPSLFPRFVQITYTSWQSDEWSYGSYSYMAVGSCADDYDTMAESVNDKVFFAGEATCRHHPATMHGALLSGHRAAAQVEIFRVLYEYHVAKSGLYCF